LTGFFKNAFMSHQTKQEKIFMAKKPTTLITQLEQARTALAEAQARCSELEQELYEAIQPELTKPEGQETIHQFGYSITVNRPMNWKLDSDKYYKLASEMPEHMQFHRTKLELDKKAYNAILSMKDNPEIKKFIKKIQDCVTATPGKVSVKVEKMEA
jgi:alkylated DNA repair dioxygenase AlkB